jgi:hypothetical protein
VQVCKYIGSQKGAEGTSIMIQDMDMGIMLDVLGFNIVFAVRL